LKWIPLSVRHRSAQALTSLCKTTVAPLMGARAGALRRQAGAMMRIWGQANNISQVQQLLLDRWHDQPLRATDNLFPIVPCQPFANSELALLLLDQLTFLPDNQLMKVDRASMRVGLEARLPFLDHRVVEFAWRTPLRLKIKGDCGKAILREVLYRYVPRELVDRPKNGFGVPLGAWLRGPLRDWAESMLTTERLLTLGGLEPSVIRRRWQEHVEGTANRHHELWHVLTLSAWLEQQAA
jgi:asparagine synthase (glutamine-hydrolysing)